MINYLYVSVTGTSPEKMLIKINNIGVQIYEIKKFDNYIIIKINSKDYLKLKKYIKTLNFRKIKYTGKLFFKNSFKRYKIFLILLLLSTFMIFMLSFLIVDIKVETTDEKLSELILSELEKYNIKKFSFRKSYNDLQEIKRQIKNNNLDKIEWIEIVKNGMTYTIKIEDRKLKEESKNEDYCNVYALKEGNIKNISVESGQIIKNINDYVYKDDIIISGDVTLNENIVNKVCAKGKVYIESYYTVNLKIPYEYYEKQKTNKKRNNIIINYDGIDHVILKDRLKNYTSKNKIVFDLLGIKIYLREDTEIKKVKKRYTDDEIINLALKKAKEKVKTSLTDDDEIILEKILQKNINDSIIDIDIFIVTKEQIGVTKKA